MAEKAEEFIDELADGATNRYSDARLLLYGVENFIEKRIEKLEEGDR